MNVEDKISFSIIIPVYNVKEEYLKCCLESCVNQTFDDIEIIIVDDGSEKECRELCDKYELLDSRIKVIHQDNKGVSAARNMGINEANGNWITFLDADDFFDNDTFSKIAKCIEDNTKIELVAFSMVKEYATKKLYNESMYGEDCIFDTEESMQRLRKDILEMQLDRNTLRLTFCKIIKASVLKKNALYFNEKLPLCEDVVFWFEVLQYVYSAYYMNQFFYHYRQVEGSATVKYRPCVVEEHENMLEYLKAIIDKTEYPEAYMKGYYLEGFYSMQRIITQGFYHVDNSLEYVDRRKKCVKTMDSHTYHNVLENVNFFELTVNHRIKYVLLKCKLYGGMQFLRNVFGLFSNLKIK